MLLYRGPREYAAACSDYVCAGAGAGAAVLVAATGQHLRRLRPRLNGCRDYVRLADLSTRGSNPGRVLSMIRMFAREHTGRSVRFVQDVGWLGRPEDGLAEAMRYEALLCEALAGCSASVRCNSDADLDADLLVAAEQRHAVVLGHGQRRGSGAPAGNASVSVALSQRLSDPPPDAIALTFRGDQAAVRRFAATQARRAGLPPDPALDVVIAVGELAGHARRHYE